MSADTDRMTKRKSNKRAERKRRRNESLRHLMLMEEVYRRLWLQGCVSPAENHWAAEAEFDRVLNEVEEEWSA